LQHLAGFAPVRINISLALENTSSTSARTIRQWNANLSAGHHPSCVNLVVGVPNSITLLRMAVKFNAHPNGNLYRLRTEAKCQFKPFVAERSCIHAGLPPALPVVALMGRSTSTSFVSAIK
jgi:hypothetical protein